MKYTRVDITPSETGTGWDVLTYNAAGLGSQTLYFELEEDLRAWLDTVLDAPLEE